MSMWYSAEQKVTKCHVLGESAEHFLHKQSVSIGKIEQATYVDVGTLPRPTIRWIVGREGATALHHKQTFNIGEIERTTYVDVVEW